VIAFTEGVDDLLNDGLPSTCWFLLSSKAESSHVVTETLAAADLGEITGTGYVRQSEPEPTPVAGVATFSGVTWSTGSAADWPADVRSIVLVTDAGTSGKAIAAWDLLGGAARDMSQARTDESVNVTLSIVG
jgi:hypothetical protein